MSRAVFDIPVVFEEKDFVVLNKPAGVLRMEWTVLYRRSRADGSA